MRTDSPINKKEDDLLERYNFAIDIVKGLLNTFENGQNSITIGINGEWGSGKSSILEFIDTEINNQTKDETTLNVLFRFNPWLFTGQADLQKSFLTQLGIHLRTINPELTKLSEDIILISSLIEIANVFNPEIISKKFIGGGSKIVQKIAKRIGKEPSLQSLKKRIDELLENSSIKVFVIIDDIDRLIPNEIANIFRLVNLNANFKNTFFFLSYDKLVVTKALEAEYKINGEQYIEKIIQLDYSIPKLSPEILEKLFLDNFNQISVKQRIPFSNKEFNRLWKAGLNEYFSNLRHIYRYFNSLEIRFPSIKDDVSFIDFSLIEAIRIFDYNAFEWIYKNKDSLIQGIDILLPMGGEGEEKQSLLDFILNNKDLNAKLNTKHLINFIFKSIHFPEFNFAFNDDNIDQEKLEREKRIAHKDFFEHYFSFKISINNISQIEINEFLKSDDEDKILILNKYRKKKFSLFLKRVVYNLNDNSKAPKLINFILNYSDKEDLQLLKDENGHNLLYTTISFLNDIGNKFGFDIYLNEILGSTTSYSRFYLQTFLRNRLIGSSNIEVVKFFPEELVGKHKKKILEKFNLSLSYFSNYYLLDPKGKDLNIINNLLRLIFEEDIDKYREIVNEYLANVETALILFRCSVTILSGIGGISYSIQNDKYILPELTIEKFDSILGVINPKEYDGTNKEFLEIFHKLKEKGFNPYYHYTIDLKEIQF
jgi:hypothetical protein